jgi:hypothetical protein
MAFSVQFGHSNSALYDIDQLQHNEWEKAQLSDMLSAATAHIKQQEFDYKKERIMLNEQVYDLKYDKEQLLNFIRYQESEIEDLCRKVKKFTRERRVSVQKTGSNKIKK